MCQDEEFIGESILKGLDRTSNQKQRVKEYETWSNEHDEVKD